MQTFKCYFYIILYFPDYVWLIINNRRSLKGAASLSNELREGARFKKMALINIVNKDVSFLSFVFISQKTK